MSKINKVRVNNVSYDIEDASKILQVDTMPTASVDTVGQIIQYIGASDANYHNGYFYIGVNENSTYKWVEIATQAPPSNYRMLTTFNFFSDKPGFYTFNPTNNFCYYESYSAQSQSEINVMPIYINYFYDVRHNPTVGGFTDIATIIGILNDYTSADHGKLCSVRVQFTNGKKIKLTVSTADVRLLLKKAQTIEGVKTFTSIPKQSDTTAPTQNTEFTNKKYVDDQDKSLLNNIASAYDATSTYDEGDYVIYNGLLYKCNTTISTAEAWTAAHWTQTTVMAEIKSQITSALNGSY